MWSLVYRWLPKVVVVTNADEVSAGLVKIDFNARLSEVMNRIAKENSARRIQSFFPPILRPAAEKPILKLHSTPQ